MTFRARWYHLLLAIGIACCLVGWVTYFYNGYHHRCIARSLESRGHTVTFSHHKTVTLATAPNAMGTPVMEVSTLHPLIEQAGLSMAFRRIEAVTIRASDPQNLNVSLSEVASLGVVRSLSFYDTGVTEQDIESLLHAVQVESLYLCGEPIGRDRMPWLNHDSLKWLCVARTQFSNPAIDDLPESLEYFDATRTRISDQGLPKLKRLRNLKTLKLLRTPTSQKAINDLKTDMPWCEIQWQPLTRP